MSTVLAVVVGLGLIALLLVIYDYMHLKKVTRVHEAAIAKGSQVGVIPDGFEYADEMTDFCYQAALSGWQPNNCSEMFQFAQVNYPQFADQLTTFWPWYYQNTFWPTFGGSSGWWSPNHRHWNNFRGHNRRHVRSAFGVSRATP